MQNVLVTGGAGFIGSNFIHYLLHVQPSIRILNLDALTYAGSLENLRDIPSNEYYTFVQGDICDSKTVNRLLRQFQIDTVVHFAAESHVDRSILGPGQFIQTNIVGTFVLLDAVTGYWKQESKLESDSVRFHHVSTDEVFGSLDPGAPAWGEAMPYAPNSPYAASKASSDHLVRAYGCTYGLPYTITNCSNNYGPYQFPEKLIPLTILNAIAGKPLPIYGDGQQVRDWLHVEDHCEAIYFVLTKGKVSNTYNIGGENQQTNLAIVESICDILDEIQPDSKHSSRRKFITHVKDRPGHDRRYALSSQKISRELGWRPRHILSDGLHETVSWYLEHPQWVAAIRRQQEYQSWLDSNYTSR